jgi:hypothetical protein
VLSDASGDEVDRQKVADDIQICPRMKIWFLGREALKTPSIVSSNKSVDIGVDGYGLLHAACQK